MYCLSEFFRSKDGREYFWQWDTNQTLTVLRPELTEVHYASPDGTALVTKTYERDGRLLSDVPNILLQQSGWLTVWFCDDDKTIRSQKITIAARQKPASYVYTETEVLTWESLDERITALEENGTGGGGQGKPGVTFIPNVSENGIISWENDGGLDNPEPRDITGPAGKDGKDGRDGVDGKDGADGLPGEKGEKGDKGDTGEPGQPGAKGDKGDSGEKGEKGDTGAQGIQGEKGEKGDPGQPGADGLPGAKGDKGDKGDPGEPGSPGQNGISPIVSVQDIDGGHRVTITDAEGEKTFDVMDGKDGTGGGGASVQSDWSQNDPEQADYVKNRPFYGEETPIIFAAGAYVSEPDPDLGGVYVAYMYLINTYPSEVPNVINVTLDSVEYTNLSVTDTIFGFPACGNLSKLNFFGGDYEDTGEPFILIFVDLNYWALGTDLTKSTSHTFFANIPGKTQVQTIVPDRNILPYSGAGHDSAVFNDMRNVASGASSFSEGVSTTASGIASHAEGYHTIASNIACHAEGRGTIAAGGDGSHAEGYECKVFGGGVGSHAEGWDAIAHGEAQHVQGKCNIEDTQNKYAHIVGNGTNIHNRSNAHTLDWFGNAWYAGYVEGTALILPSPNGTRWRITVDDSGNLVTAVET